jgi:hypothetical protein
MKADFRVTVQIGDAKARSKIVQVDALWMKDKRGIVLVWEWTMNDDGSETPVDYTQLPLSIPTQIPGTDDYVLEGKPVFIEDLENLGKRSRLPPESES